MSVLLACRGLSVRFGGLVALDALDLEVRQGAILGLIGPNGSGKTTFFNVITGVYSAAAGEARFGGEDLTRLAPQRIYAAGITRTFQRSRLALPLSIFDNVMIGNHRLLDHGLWFNLFRRAALKRQLEENLEKARALVAAFSKRLAGRMFDAVGAFSMIDRRRIEICRALVSEPRLLLLDEPSAGMTHEETRELMEDMLAVRARVQGLTLVIIEHEMNVIERITERCVVLNYGRKISEGAYAEVARDPERRTSGIGNEPGPRPQPGAGRGRPRGLEPELTAELRRPRLPPEERIGAGIQRDAGHLHRPQRPAGTLRRLQHDDIDRRIRHLQPEGSRQTGDAGAHDRDTGRHVSHRARIARARGRPTAAGSRPACPAARRVRG